MPGGRDAAKRASGMSRVRSEEAHEHRESPEGTVAQADVRAVQLGDARSDRQPQAGALAGSVPKEALEDARAQFGRNAVAAVLHA